MQIKWSQHALYSLADVPDYTLEAFGYVQQAVMEDIILSSTDVGGYDTVVSRKEYEEMYFRNED